MNRNSGGARLAAEGALIVVSILLAFAIDTWWDDRGRSADERTLKSDLGVEFRSNLHVLDSLIARHKQFPVLIAALESATPDQIRAIPADSAQLFQAAMASGSTFDAQIGTVDGAITSGTLALLSDESARRLIIAWRGELDDAREQSGTIIRASEKVLYQLARHGGPWIGGAVLSGEDLLGLCRDDELMGLVRVKLAYTVFYISHLEMMAALTREILAALEGG